MTSNVTHYGNEALAQATAEAFKPRTRKTHCKRGHELTDQTRMSQNRCLICHNARERARKQQLRAAAAAAREAAERHEAERQICNINGLERFLAQRRRRGVPEGGREQL